MHFFALLIFKYPLPPEAFQLECWAKFHSKSRFLMVGLSVIIVKYVVTAPFIQPNLQAQSAMFSLSQCVNWFFNVVDVLL